MGLELAAAVLLAGIPVSSVCWHVVPLSIALTRAVDRALTELSGIVMIRKEGMDYTMVLQAHVYAMVLSCDGAMLC